MGNVGDDKEGHPAWFSVLMPALGFVWASGTQAQPSGGWAPPGTLPWGLGLPVMEGGALQMEMVGQARGPQDVEMAGCWDAARTESTPHTWPRGSQARSEGGPEGLSRVVRVPWGRRAGGLQGGLALSRRGLRGAGGHPDFSGVSWGLPHLGEGRHPPSLGGTHERPGTPQICWSPPPSLCSIPLGL